MTGKPSAEQGGTDKTDEAAKQAERDVGEQVHDDPGNVAASQKKPEGSAPRK